MNVLFNLLRVWILTAVEFAQHKDQGSLLFHFQNMCVWCPCLVKKTFSFGACGHTQTGQIVIWLPLPLTSSCNEYI